MPMVTEANILQLIIIVVASYLLGSLPTAYIIAKFRRINVFEIGSGNMGGTNIARSMGLSWGIATIIVDICKGMVAVWLGRKIMADAKMTASIIAAVAVISGHNWSLFASLLYTYYNKGKFAIRGGKGAATAVGTMIMLVPWQPIAGMLFTGIALVLLTRYVSLSVLTGIAVSLIWTVALIGQEFLSQEYIPYVIVLTVLILWRFRENIHRLFTGTERKLGERV